MKPKNKAAREFMEDENAAFVNVKRDISGSVMWENIANNATGSITTAGSSTVKIDQNLAAMKFVMSGATAATGNLSLNGNSITTFTGASTTISTLFDSPKGAVNTATINVNTLTGTANYTIQKEQNLF